MTTLSPLAETQLHPAKDSAFGLIALGFGMISAAVVVVAVVFTLNQSLEMKAAEAAAKAAAWVVEVAKIDRAKTQLPELRSEGDALFATASTSARRSCAWRRTSPRDFVVCLRVERAHQPAGR